MFKNCGSTVKGIALINFWLMVIAGVIVGIWLLSEEGPVGLLVISGAVIGGWLENVALYTIGDTWERVKNIESSVTEKTIDDNDDDDDETDDEYVYTGSGEAIWLCPKCQKENSGEISVCQHCGFHV